MDHLNQWLKMADVEVAAICDIDENVIHGAMDLTEKVQEETRSTRPRLLKTSRSTWSGRTCNHWHSLAGIWAVQAGKHAYVEKPISHNVFEGRKLVEAGQKYKKVVAVGTQCRSMKGMREAMDFLHSGKIGKVKVARGFCYKSRKSIGKRPNGPVPSGVDFDIWLGPAPERAFNPNRFHYNWHWMWDTGNGDLGNQGVHQVDIARWGINKNEHPISTISVGGRLGYEDDGETPTRRSPCRTTATPDDLRGARPDTDKYGHKGTRRPGVVGDVFECTEGPSSSRPTAAGSRTPERRADPAVRRRRRQRPLPELHRRDQDEQAGVAERAGDRRPPVGRGVPPVEHLAPPRDAQAAVHRESVRQERGGERDVPPLPRPPQGEQRIARHELRDGPRDQVCF
jgi:predicted dehydrogenase